MKMEIISIKVIDTIWNDTNASDERIISTLIEWNPQKSVLPGGKIATIPNVFNYIFDANNIFSTKLSQYRSLTPLQNCISTH